jgi:hypothetical protein
MPDFKNISASKLLEIVHYEKGDNSEFEQYYTSRRFVEKDDQFRAGRVDYLKFESIVVDDNFKCFRENWRHLDITFKNCIFNGEVNFDVGGITIRTYDSTFNKGLILRGDGLLSIHGGIFKQCDEFHAHMDNIHPSILLYGDYDIWLYGGDFSGYMFLRGGKYSLHINGSYKKDTILVTHAKVSSIWFIDVLGISEVKLTECTIGKILLKSNTSTEFTLQKSKLNTFKVEDSTLQKDAKITIDNTYVFNLLFERVLNYGNITLRNIKAIPNFEISDRNWVAHDNNNFDHLDFIDSNNKSTISIVNTIFGKADIISSNLSKFKLEYENSKLTEVFLAGTKMPNDIELPENSLENINEQQRVGYGQIKKIYENRGDLVESSLYFSKEMNAYYEMLSWRTETWEKLNLKLNHLSTNHGLHWEKGLISTIIVAISFYLIYCIALGYELTLKEKDWDTFRSISSFFWEFLNPVHKTDFIADALKIKPTFWARTIEGFSRVFIGYFIYQLIQAFRKYGRK